MDFSGAINAVSTDVQNQVNCVLDQWKSGSDPSCRQLAANLESELLLSCTDFPAFLAGFSRELENGVDSLSAFDEVCKGHKLCGPRLAGVSPKRLGRATELSRLCSWISDQNPTMPMESVERLVRRHAISRSGSPSSKIEYAPLGRHVIWATFRNPERTEDPFVPPLSTKESIRTALGLGGLDRDTPWVLLVYEPECDRRDFRVPTVADAGNCAYFRPVRTTCPPAEHGLTEPLLPNPNHLPGQPELVHGDAISYRLCLPLVIVE